MDYYHKLLCTGVISTGIMVCYLMVSWDMGTFGGDTRRDKTNPIRRYYVVPIVIAIASIIYLIQIWITWLNLIFRKRIDVSANTILFSVFQPTWLLYFLTFSFLCLINQVWYTLRNVHTEIITTLGMTTVFVNVIQRINRKKWYEIKKIKHQLKWLVEKLGRFFAYFYNFW